MVLREYLFCQNTNTGGRESLRRASKPVSEKNQEGVECPGGLQEKITSCVFRLMKSIAVTVYARLFPTVGDSQMADNCEEGNTELERSSNSYKSYTEVDKGSIVTDILSNSIAFQIKVNSFVDVGLAIFQKDDNTLEVRGEHSKEHPKDSVEWLQKLVKQASDRTLFIHDLAYFEFPTQKYSIFSVHGIQYSCSTQIFDQNTDPCFVDLKRFLEKLSEFCGSPLSHTKLPDIDLSDVVRLEQFQQILKTLEDLEKALLYRPPTDDSTGRPDGTNMQNMWKLFERFLLQRFAIESQDVSTSPFITLRSYFEKLARGQALSTEEEMRYEGLRFASFEGINMGPSALRLAAAGFYATGDGDETRCFSCGVRHRDWELRDNPFVIHSRISPNCIHATGTDERNVPIQLPSGGATGTPPREGDDCTHVGDESDSSTHLEGAVGGAVINTEGRCNQNVDGISPMQSARLIDGALPSSPTSRLRFEDAVHPHYSNSGRRLESFRLWPEGHTHNPEELVQAGFFYAGYSDCVRCFVCGLGLRTWEEGDDPWVEHVRWRSSCAYVEAAKGKNFIIQTLAAIGRGTHTPEQNPGGIQQRSSNNTHNHDTSEEDIITTTACERALEMGFSRGHVTLAAQSIIASAGRQALTLPALLERILVVGSPDETVGARGGYSGENFQEQNGLAGSVKPNEMGNMDRRSSGEKNNTTTRQAHLLRSPGLSTDSGYHSLPVENHFRLPQARQTSGDVHTGHTNTNINYNLEIGGQQSLGTENSVTEERGRPKKSNAPVTRFSSFHSSRHEIKEIDKIQKTDCKKGRSKEDLKATAEETRQLKDSNACKICLDDPANIVFLPCGHLVACAMCAPALQLCPVCRKHIRGTVRVYMISREKHIDRI